MGDMAEIPTLSRQDIAAAAADEADEAANSCAEGGRRCGL